MITNEILENSVNIPNIDQPNEHVENSSDKKKKMSKTKPLNIVIT